MAVVAPGPLSGKTIRGVQFRTNFSAAVLAVRRQGRHLCSRLGDIEMQARMQYAPTFS